MELSKNEKAKHLSQWTTSLSVKLVKQFKARLHNKNNLFSFTTFANCKDTAP